jgi:hypothetical protein
MRDDDLAPLLAFAKGNVTAGLVLGAVCLGIASLGFLDPAAGPAIRWGLAVPFGSLGLFIGVIALRPASKHAAIVALKARGADVVWVYEHRLMVNGRPSQTFLTFAFVDGSEKALALGATTDPTPLLEHCRRVFPHATVGFSEANLVQFKSNPASLRR